MSRNTLAPVVVALAMGAGSIAVGQTPPKPSPVAAPPLAAAPSFPAGAEVLSVDGEPLGVLARVEHRPGGERILHIRRTDGSMTTAPATVASRGERAVVLEWTRAEFDSPGAAVVAATPPTEPSPPPPM
jgi:hypothetical protein